MHMVYHPEAAKMVKSSYTQILFLIALFSLSVICNAVKVAQNVDVKKYMGRWYEIASVPNLFIPPNGRDTRATYTLNPNGTFNVFNEIFVDGKSESITALAYKANASDDEARFKLLFNIGYTIEADYCVYYVDPLYQYAAVGSDSLHQDLFILSRTTRMENRTYEMLYQKAKEHGYRYNITLLHKTVQSDHPPPAANQGPKDTKSVGWFKSLLRRQ